jgi:hypothetical protein
MKSPVTTWHGIAAIAGAAGIGVGMHLMGVSDGTTAAVMAIVGTTFTSMGLMHASDQQVVNNLISDVNKTVDTAKADVAAVVASAAAPAQADAPKNGGAVKL